MQKIVPHLWFDKEAKEAAAFYAEAFGRGSKVTKSFSIEGTPSGTADIVWFELLGFEFQAISAGPVFKPNPSISFMVNFDPSRDPEAQAHLDALWTKLSEGGKALMPLQEYPFSERYGWIQDKYGFSWQLILTKPEGEPRPDIIPSLLFVTASCEAAEKATDLYLSVFKDAKRGTVARYPAGMEPNKEGSIMFSDFTLEGQWFVAMDAPAKMHAFAFNEAVSLIVDCKDQAEVDYYWEKLSAVPEAEQCGWIKDAYGVSWQIIPGWTNALFDGPDKEASARAVQAMLKMKKLDGDALQAAYDGR